MRRACLILCRKRVHALGSALAVPLQLPLQPLGLPLILLALVAPCPRRFRYMLSVDPFVLPLKRTGIKFPDHIEHCRKKIMRAMKAGGTIAISIRDLVPDFPGKICAAKHKGAILIELFQVN